MRRGIDSGRRLGAPVVYAQRTSVADQIPLHGAIAVNGAVVLGWRIGGVAVRYDHGGRVAHLVLPGRGGRSAVGVSSDGDYGRVVLVVLVVVRWRRMIQEIQVRIGALSPGFRLGRQSAQGSVDHPAEEDESVCRVVVVVVKP